MTRRMSKPETTWGERLARSQQQQVEMAFLVTEKKNTLKTVKQTSRQRKVTRKTTGWLKRKSARVQKLTCEPSRRKGKGTQGGNWRRLSLALPCRGWQVFYITRWLKGKRNPHIPAACAFIRRTLNEFHTGLKVTGAYSSTLKAE